MASRTNSEVVPEDGADEHYSPATPEQQEQTNFVVDEIYGLYAGTIGKFKRGELPVYNPDLFADMTEQKFFDWVVQNSPDAGKLFG